MTKVQLRVEHVILARTGDIAKLQQVYAGPTLGTSEHLILQERITPFQPEGDPLRLQFFRMESTRYAITHTVATGKGGSDGPDFLCHCVLISEEAFSRIGYNPFVLLSGMTFVEDYDSLASELPQIIAGEYDLINVDLINIHDCDITLSEARKLVLLGLRSDQTLRRTQSIAFVGNDHQIQDALYAAFALLPRQKRAACSFDSAVDKAPAKPGNHWALGFAKSPSNPNLTVVDVARNKLALPDTPPSEQEPYLQWLWRLGGHLRLNETTLRMITTFEELSYSFTTRREPQEEHLDAEGCAEFLDVFRAKVNEGLSSAIQMHMNARFKLNLVEYLLQITQHDELPNLLAVAASRRLEAADLAIVTMGWVLDRDPELDETDWRMILTLLTTSQTVDRLDVLAPAVAQWNDRALSAFERASKGNEEIPYQMGEAVRQRRAQLGGNKTGFSFWKR